MTVRITIFDYLFQIIVDVLSCQSFLIGFVKKIFHHFVVFPFFVRMKNFVKIV